MMLNNFFSDIIIFCTFANATQIKSYRKEIDLKYPISKIFNYVSDLLSEKAIASDLTSKKYLRGDYKGDILKPLMNIRHEDLLGLFINYLPDDESHTLAVNTHSIIQIICKLFYRQISEFMMSTDLAPETTQQVVVSEAKTSVLGEIPVTKPALPLTQFPSMKKIHRTGRSRKITVASVASDERVDSAYI